MRIPCNVLIFFSDARFDYKDYDVFWKKIGDAPGPLCNATYALRLLPLNALAQNVPDYALLKKSQKIVVFYSKREKTCSKPEVLHEKLKTVLPALILKKNIDLQLLKILKPIRILLCNDLFCVHIHLYLKYIPYYY